MLLDWTTLGESFLLLWQWSLHKKTIDIVSSYISETRESNFQFLSPSVPSYFSEQDPDFLLKIWPSSCLLVGLCTGISVASTMKENGVKIVCGPGSVAFISSMDICMKRIIIGISALWI